MSRFYLKKTYVNVDMAVEDCFDNVTDESKLQKKVQFTSNAIVAERNVKFIRSTVEEINEKKYKEQVKKSNSKKNKSISTSEIKKD
jgi:hypothetical protein|tara:strand:- start:449 stop:706 length:258 start_codon:yes stop_codon:yes gene_type:complete